MPAAECGWRELRRQQRRGFRLASQADEFRKETPLRKKLVLHDLQHRGRTLGGLESRFFRRELAPYAHYLAGFAGIGIEQMLEDRICGAWHLRLRNRRVFILHWHDAPVISRLWPVTASRPIRVLRLRPQPARRKQTPWPRCRCK